LAWTRKAVSTNEAIGGTFSFLRGAHKNTKERPKWGIADEVIRAPVGGQAGGGKSANCTPEGIGLSRGGVSLMK